jgi:hypothetical protein
VKQVNRRSSHYLWKKESQTNVNHNFAKINAQVLEFQVYDWGVSKEQKRTVLNRQNKKASIPRKMAKGYGCGKQE